MEYSFGNWIKRRRKALDLTQQELADRVGCSLSLIFKIESDERRPSRQIAELLGEHLEIPPEQRALFLQIARRDKSMANLADIPALSGLEPLDEPADLPSNLPVYLTSLVGREFEIDFVCKQLLDPGCRLLTLTGPGGVGKTRLAVEAASRLETKFKHGVFFLSMSGVTLAESLLPLIADGLGIAFPDSGDPKLHLIHALRKKVLLLVVDNLEHLIPAGSILGELLQQVAGLKLLLTSREPLHLQGEWIFDVQGLPVPESGASDLGDSSAAALFLQRARQISPDFSLSNAGAPLLVQICKSVDGLPLAIELAASWVRVLALREILLELERGLDFLETRLQDVPDRHRSIRGVIEQSWALLSEDECVVLMKLSAFSGGFTRPAAEAVAGATLFSLSSLVSKSLLRHNNQTDRYALHELVRQYASLKLQEKPDEAVRSYERHSRYYSGWLADLERPLKSSQQIQVAAQIRAETSNWIAAWRWAVQNRRLDLLRPMVPCLYWYYEIHGYYAEALSAYRFAVSELRAAGMPESLKQPQDVSAFAFLVDQSAWFEFRSGNNLQAAALFAESLELAKATADSEVLYHIHGNWGYMALLNGQIEPAERLTLQSLEDARRLGSPWHIAIPTSVLGIVSYQRGDAARAYAELSGSLKFWRSVGDPRGLVFCMLYLSSAALLLGEIEAAETILHESHAIAEEKMDRWAQAFGLDLLGQAALARGDYAQAQDRFQRSMALYDEIGAPWGTAQVSIHLAEAQAGLGSGPQARDLLRQVFQNAWQAQWVPTILEALVAFLSLDDEIVPQTKLAALQAVQVHPAITPQIRQRVTGLSERWSDVLAGTPLQTEKSAETWATEIFGLTK